MADPYNNPTGTSDLQPGLVKDSPNHSLYDVTKQLGQIFETQVFSPDDVVNVLAGANTSLSPSSQVNVIPDSASGSVIGSGGRSAQAVNLVIGNSSNITLATDVGSGTGRPLRFEIVAVGSGNQIATDGAHRPVSLNFYSAVGNDTIVAASGPNTIMGSYSDNSLADSIVAGGRSSIVAGWHGDTIDSGFRDSDRNTIVAGGGGDQITVSHGNNLIAGIGKAAITAGDGFDSIYGGTGQQTITGGGTSLIGAGAQNKIFATGSDTVLGGYGRNTISSANGAQSIRGGPGHLEINVAKTANDTIFGGSRHDVVHVAQSSANITSQALTDGATTITFSSGQVLQVQDVTLVLNDHTKFSV